ncbi:alpha/beta fold hydrolase [Variovorax guangxiensis]|uniref:Alpha/beta hydrolase n=1 Tax=Variovorax guangxiensis TaxID=1775474 RepID=A0A502DFM7_9BURK|nr:alpha/beta hydrolase [Variovorax guangxiensis]TPG23490.1 alpha/beta hydrolase [Variovorax guangxiensis]TPG24051.1 alpha/beta hydrolase [Variovorax ginsengisoli]
MTQPTEYVWADDRVRVNGIELHYVRTGHGPPLVLIHGWPEFWRTWRRIIPALAARHDVIAYDLRGFGLSEKPPGEALESYTLEHHIADLAGLLDALDLHDVGLVSHDSGANVAQGYARLNPARLSGLFFFDCPYPGIGERWADARVIRESWYQYFNQLPWTAQWLASDRAHCRRYIHWCLDHWSHAPGAFDDDLEAWVDNFMLPGNLQGSFNWYRAMQPWRERLIREGAPSLPRIKVPTRVRWGASDPVLLPEFADRLGDYFEDPDVALVENAGHFVAFERPAFASAEILEFFAALAPTRAVGTDEPRP